MSPLFILVLWSAIRPSVGFTFFAFESAHMMRRKQNILQPPAFAVGVAIGNDGERGRKKEASSASALVVARLFRQMMPISEHENRPLPLPGWLLVTGKAHKSRNCLREPPFIPILHSLANAD